MAASAWARDRGGHPDEPDAPVGRGRGKTRHVDEGAAAHGRHIGVAAQARRLDGLMEDGDVQRIVFHRFPAGEQQGRPGTGR